jgi:G:T/U-mismatch repair DNA glycosylase
MFKHQHPYPPFIPENSAKLIVGTLPPPRFTTQKLKKGDVDFCYGSRDGQLWVILNRIFKLNLDFENTSKAVKQRKNFLIEHKIGICDMVDCAYREKVDASDLGIQKARLRPMIEILEKNPSLNKLIFTGGRSKNGPEYFFRKHLKKFTALKLKSVSETVPRQYCFTLNNRTIHTVSLTAPSGSANRAVGSMKAFKIEKEKNPNFTTLDFRVEQYEPFFR